jgi:hypothetical protein
MRPAIRNPTHKVTVETRSERQKAVMTGVRMGTGAAPHDVMSNGMTSRGRRNSEDITDEGEECEVYSKDPGEPSPDHIFN